MTPGSRSERNRPEQLTQEQGLGTRSLRPHPRLTRLARRWIATQLLANSAAIRSSSCDAQLGQPRPCSHVCCTPCV